MTWNHFVNNVTYTMCIGVKLQHFEDNVPNNMCLGETENEIEIGTKTEIETKYRDIKKQDKD